MNQDLLALTHTADEYDKYLNAVVPPVFMNSLHVYDSFEDYCNVDVYKDNDKSSKVAAIALSCG